MPTTITKNDDPSRPDAASRISPSLQIPTIEAPEFASAVEQLDVSTLAASLTLPDNSTYLLSPPTSSWEAPQRHPFSLSDLLNGTDGKIESLGTDIAAAEISIPTDGSYVETSSGPAVRELKRRYDQLAGVCATFRSPYAITAFVNQHGKSMFRLGHRDEHSAPALSAAEADDRISQSNLSPDASVSSRKRRSRLSMNFLPPSMFAKNAAQSTSGHTRTSPKKMHRQVRSIPDLVSATVGEHTTESRISSSAFAVTGRGHSQSVTAADAVRPICFRRTMARTDTFAELLDLTPAENTLLPNFSTSADAHQTLADVSHPFGPGITFNMPLKKGQVNRLRPPRQLREMQSFDSAITARQDDVSVENLSQPEHELARPPSAIRLSDLTSFSARVETPDITLEAPVIEMEASLSFESSQLCEQHFVDLFDVLQKYSGLPVFESFVPEADEGTTVIKLSLSTDTNVAPRDDPRFVIWGEYVPEQDFDDYNSSSRDSVVDIMTSLSRRKSNRTSKLRSPGASSTHSARQETSQRVLLAGTIERWIAQLTSTLNYDELLDFFLTYRSYINAVDLCHLLICRFHWALQKTSTKDDEIVRRTVRVRTFVAIRYWMSTFFTVDFIPNRELRLLISGWLNTLVHDPVLQKHMDGIGIVRGLIKVGKDCKKAHIKHTHTDTPTTTPSPQSPSIGEDAPDHVLGKSFAKAIRKEAIDIDLDLDFLPDEAKSDDHLPGFPSDPANAHLAVAHVAGAVGLSQGRPTSLSMSSFNAPRSEHIPGPNFDNLPPMQSHVSADRDSVLSRAFVRTIGRLGKWKHILKPKLAVPKPKHAPSGLPSGSAVSVFDLGVNASSDVLTTDRVDEDFLKSTDQSPPLSHGTSFMSHVSSTPSSSPRNSFPPAQIPPGTHIAPLPLRPPSDALNDGIVSQQRLSADEPSEAHPAVRNGNAEFGEFARRESFCSSSSTDSFGVPLTSDGPFPPTIPGSHQPWQFDIVSIDDLDFSDTSSLPGGPEPPHPPGLQKPRKLPMRRDFEFVRRSEVSSMGIISHESFRDSASSSMSETSPTNSNAGPQPIKRWQMKSLQRTFEDMSTHSDDKGDVEAALRRLEGQINPRILQENAEKVNGWVRNLQERMVNGNYEHSVYSEDDDEVEDFIDEVDATPPVTAVHGESEEIVGDGSGVEGAISGTPILDQSAPQQSVSASLDDSPTLVEEAVPMAILQCQISPSPNPPVKLTPPMAPRSHFSFILSYSAEQLAQHFTMIDRELFISIKFEELVTGEWLDCEEIDILDWAQFLKERARWKAESRCAHKTTALAAVRARFNLTAAFVNAEVVLTPPDERSSVVSKFIRIAWHCYQLCNFQTLTAIIIGLQSDWVSKAMGKPGWTRLGIFENRMLRDLRQFTSKHGDFKFLRQAVDSMGDTKPLPTSSRTSSIIGADSGKGKANSEKRPAAAACVPFIGTYLSQLHRLNQLPAVIDPTAPNNLLRLDPIKTVFHPLAHPEVFSTLTPLPTSMRLEPLVNIHKQRRVAEVIKSLVAGQHLASRVYFDVDRKLFQKCLRLRGVDVACLQWALDIHPD